jgi:hypothetical protein
MMVKSETKHTRKSVLKGLLILLIFIFAIVFVQSKTNSVGVVDSWHSGSEIHTSIQGNKSLQQLFSENYFSKRHRGSCNGMGIQGYSAGRDIIGCTRIKP